MSRAMREVRVLDDREAGEQERETTAPTQTALTVAFCSRRPKKNIIAAPKAGKSGISQMWSRKTCRQSSVVSRSLFAIR